MAKIILLLAPTLGLVPLTHPVPTLHPFPSIHCGKGGGLVVDEPVYSTIQPKLSSPKTATPAAVAAPLPSVEQLPPEALFSNNNNVFAGGLTGLLNHDPVLPRVIRFPLPGK